MADDNVTEMPEKQQGTLKAKTAKAILNEIKAASLNEKAAAFKKKAIEKQQEIEKLRKTLAAAEHQLAEMIKEYEAEISI